MTRPKPQWLVDLERLVVELRERDDELVRAGLLPPLTPRPPLVLIRGGRADG